ncbi:MAG: flagellar protein FlaG [Motiliproteus sp.]
MAENITIAATAPRVPPQQSAPQAAAEPAAQSVDPQNTIKQVDAAAKAEASAGSVEQAQVSAEKLQASIEQLNQFMKEGQRSLAFTVDKSADEVVVKITDRDTNELIRQIPTEEALAIREHLDKVMGMLFSEKV